MNTEYLTAFGAACSELSAILQKRDSDGLNSFFPPLFDPTIITTITNNPVTAEEPKALLGEVEAILKQFQHPTDSRLIENMDSLNALMGAFSRLGDVLQHIATDTDVQGFIVMIDKIIGYLTRRAHALSAYLAV